MEANEAPEKLWIDPATDLPKLSGHIDKDSVEYTRTDAFIEKACAFIRKRLIFDDNAWYIEGEVTVKDQVIGNFKDYMKGE